MKRTETTDGGHSCPPREVGTIPTEIGTIAADWRIAPLDAVCEPPQYGFTASAEAKGNVRFLRITDITDSGVKWPTVPFCECPEKELGKYRLAPGDIVFARIGATTGKSYLIMNPPPSVFASYLIRVRAKPEIYPEFLSQFFRSDAYWRQVDAQKNANLKKGVSGSVLKTLLVPVPPLAEQRKIAGMLGVVQRAMEQQERLLALTAELKKALLHKLFTEGLRGELQKQTDIGPLPESWEVRRLGDVAQVKGGKRLPKGDKFAEGPTPFPYIRVTDFAEFGVDTSDLRYLRPDTHSSIKRYTISTRDVYISIAGSIGLTGMISPELEGANLTENAARFVITAPNVDARFMMYFLGSESAQKEIRSQTVKNAQPKLALARIASLNIPVPSNDEQREIVEALDTLGQKQIVGRQKQRLLTALFRTLLHQLMTAQIRVHDLDLEGMLAQAVAEMDSKS